MAKKVLLVDDEQDFIDVNTMALEGEGYEVVAASNGEDGVAKAIEEKPDLVVLDVMMSTPTEGFEAARQLKQNDATKDIPIVMLTGVRKEMDVKYKLGPDDDFLPVTEFLEKPVPPPDLIAKVAQLIGKADE